MILSKLREWQKKVMSKPQALEQVIPHLDTKAPKHLVAQASLCQLSFNFWKQPGWESVLSWMTTQSCDSKKLVSMRKDMLFLFHRFLILYIFT